MPQTPSYQALPLHLRTAMRDYVEFGTRPNNFLAAVISNDLREAVGQADSTISAEDLRTLCTWLYVEAPFLCYGSEDRLIGWVVKGGTQGIAAMVQRDRAEAV